VRLRSIWWWQYPDGRHDSRYHSILAQHLPGHLDSCLAWCLFPSNPFFFFSSFPIFRSHCLSAFWTHGSSPCYVHQHTNYNHHHHLVSHRIRAPFRDHHDSSAIFPKFCRAVPVRDLFALYNCRIVSARLLNYIGSIFRSRDGHSAFLNATKYLG